MSYKLENIRILIVDDFDPILRLMRDVLNAFGITHIDLARNGQDAYEMLCKNDHDLVILDWRMEPMDGLELSTLIRSNPKTPNPYVPILMVSGYSAREKVEIARDAGVTEFLGKPFTPQGLYKRIEKIIEKPRQFVKTDEFFGPDRRRKKTSDYQGKDRRAHTG